MKRVVVIILAIVIGLGALLLFFSSPKGNKALNDLATPALKRNQQNTLRQNDVSKLASALATYISENQNTFPQTVVANNATTLAICGVDCTAVNIQSVSLDYYANTADAVSFRQYSADLVVPDLQTAYIVPNANCKEDKSGIGISTIGQKYLSIVVLYAIQTGNDTTQQCLSPY